MFDPYMTIIYEHYIWTVDGPLVFSERERGRCMSSVCLSVVCLSVVTRLSTFVPPTQAIEIFRNVYTPLICWPSIHIGI